MATFNSPTSYKNRPCELTLPIEAPLKLINQHYNLTATRISFNSNKSPLDSLYWISLYGTVKITKAFQWNHNKQPPFKKHNNKKSTKRSPLLPKQTLIYCILTKIIILATLASGSSAFDPSSRGQEDSGTQSVSETGRTFYQPVLIGIRSDTVRGVTPGGVSVIEANSPITLTLFGESFTTNTIVAFTTEFQPDIELLSDPAQSTHVTDQTKPAPTVRTITTTSKPIFTTTSEVANFNPADSVGLILALNRAKNESLATNNNEKTKRRFANRRRSQSRSYDCTDYNRVTSYKLTNENILSPNVAVLTVTLPELDSGSGQYYYFCLKQPPLTGQAANQVNDFQQATNFQDDSSNESLVWVHQGDEWWVTLKVEPPILSVANDCILIMLLLFLSAVTSGLNLGLMSLDMNELAVISSCGDQRERSYARTIAPLRKRGNYLLCALLLGNVMVNSTLTVILEEMTSGLVAVIGSTLAIVVLGEIVPQAFCARQGLAIGARTIYLTYAFMILTFPLSYPISRLLDYVLGEEKGNVYDRERLMEFIKITGHHTQLEADEVAIISGALKLKKIKVDQIMTRIEDVFMLPIDCKLDRETIKRIIEKGYSRIPVYEFGDRKQIVALILAKDLALIDPDDHTPIENMLMYCKHPLIFIDDDATLDVALNEFKTGKSHMAVVRQIYDDGEIDKYYEAIGVVTLEDVIEEVLQTEINDETDILSDNRRKRRRTDAQVAHITDEITCTSLNSTPTTLKLDCELANRSSTALYELPLSKQLQNSLSSQLTSVSIGGVAHSLAQSTAQQSLATTELCNSGSLSDNLHFLSARQSVELSLGSNQQQQQQQQQQQVQAQPDESETGVLSRAAQFLSNIIS